jgi:hypothetical protein
MEAVYSSETSVGTQRTTRRYIPEDGPLHNHRCENLKFFLVFVYKATNQQYDPCSASGCRRGSTTVEISGGQEWEQLEITQPNWSKLDNRII